MLAVSYQGDVPSTVKASESKVPDASLLQQVTQVLGEIVPHNLSAELTEGAGGPQIVVQGADHEGSEFKITLAQQLLLAQHLLNQVQTQRLGQGGAGAGDSEPGTEQPQITTGGCGSRGGEGRSDTQIRRRRIVNHTPLLQCSMACSRLSSSKLN